MGGTSPFLCHTVTHYFTCISSVKPFSLTICKRYTFPPELLFSLVTLSQYLKRGSVIFIVTSHFPCHIVTQFTKRKYNTHWDFSFLMSHCQTLPGMYFLCTSSVQINYLVICQCHTVTQSTKGKYKLIGTSLFPCHTVT